MAFIYSLIFLLLIDGLWLNLNKKYYAQKIGHLMADKPKIGWALFFYPVYAFGIVWFALDVNMATSFINGLFLGLIAYSAYDITNQVTLKNWPVSLTLTDIAWGSLLTGIVALLTTIII